MTNGVLASQYPSSEGEYSNVKVMQSAAGFYIGTAFIHGDKSETPGMHEPGSRESGYYSDANSATIALQSGVWDQRVRP